MFKFNENNKEQAERGTNKLIVKVSKKALKSTKIRPKEINTTEPQPVQPKWVTAEEPVFEIY